jgi:hypothetical protein
MECYIQLYVLDSYGVYRYLLLRIVHAQQPDLMILYMLYKSYSSRMLDLKKTVSSSRSILGIFREFPDYKLAMSIILDTYMECYRYQWSVIDSYGRYRRHRRKFDRKLEKRRP